MDTVFSEAAFYARHFRLPGFTQETQKRLRKARILLIGIGGLGCPAATYLAGAGVGTLGLCDADEVSASNLSRQTLFDSHSVGLKKVHVAASRLRATNPFICIDIIDCNGDESSLGEIVQKYDLVIDGTDNFAAKYAINDVCQLLAKPLIYGSIYQFEGQVSVFHLPTAEHPSGVSLRDLYPCAPPAGLTQNCGEAGVLGVLPGMIGTLQANEAIKIVTGLGTPLSGELLTFDALESSSSKHRLTRRTKCLALSRQLPGEQIEEMTADQLASALTALMPPVLIDVRDEDEHGTNSIGGLNMPLDTLPTRIMELQTLPRLVLYCRSGTRSAKAALYLRSVLPRTSISTLKGGIDRWNFGENSSHP